MVRHFKKTKGVIQRCQICCAVQSKLQAAHLFDHALKKECEELHEKNENMPISINAVENGLLMCLNCHGLFDAQPTRLLHITVDGTIEMSGTGRDYAPGGSLLHGQKVPWASKIDHKNWPTSDLLTAVHKLVTKKRKKNAAHASISTHKNKKKNKATSSADQEEEACAGSSEE